LPGRGYDADMTAAYTITRRRPSGVCAGGVVRMLTPLECERAFGFPDGYTAIPFHGKPVAPRWTRYRALGNSMCVNVMRWVGERIAAVDAGKEFKDYGPVEDRGDHGEPSPLAQEGGG
jgi:DNA (cytosine-5)-methyltransferase 1